MNTSGHTKEKTLEETWKAPKMSRTPGFPAISGINFTTLTGAVLIHIGAIAAPFFFSWSGLAVCILLLFMTAQVGLSLGFHRLLAHKSFRTSTTVTRILALLGTLAHQAGPVTWVAIHRVHHKYADRELDPHTPRKSLAWAYFMWAFVPDPRFCEEGLRALADDVATDPFLLFLDRNQYGVCVLCFLTLFFLGYGMGGLYLGGSLVLWGGCVRTVYVWHAVFLINSLGHLSGYRNYATPDNSQNSPLIFLVALGEGWQNNHHAFPSSAGQGHRVFEFDPIYMLIRVLGKLGLVTSIIPPPSLGGGPSTHTAKPGF